ncbi:Cytochrome c oxidase assembly protein COX19 [Galdieria sulphuraria]|uniref:Cytochrome c oxidase assembly protein COX19 n=1 Tax=Galdieria sulphuraria TaxID=130081 RepID=M2XD77_GALSU|nr:uncharacterized protein Gasu_45560 [Galdieria sulphuraria]EME27892.1 hypothetical protein Gasu_45560 [Galdieria sulphuraria]GJD07805.1 Cytochrome c oxidase assembly protein COX19 [Galdieria sulphuraria]|eukprot:XP_005704412.1 hypothetical protein Gasu_45560 [Galdieria sulphuraria]
MASPTTQPRSSARAPEKGSFPLDHQHICKEFAEKFRTCLEENNYVTAKCRSLSKLYLQCRMQNGLMTPESWERLGFYEDDEQRIPSNLNLGPESHQASGYVAGLRYRKKRREMRQQDNQEDS